MRISDWSSDVCSSDLPAEKRSPRHAPSYEKFRFLAKLNTVRLREADGSLRRLTVEELGRAVTDFGLAGKSVTWNAVAKKLGLPKGVFFDGIDEKKAQNDIAARSEERTSEIQSLMHITSADC